MSATTTGSRSAALTLTISATTIDATNTVPQKRASCVCRASQNRGESRFSSPVPRIWRVATVLMSFHDRLKAGEQRWPHSKSGSQPCSDGSRGGAVAVAKDEPGGAGAFHHVLG